MSASEKILQSLLLLWKGKKRFEKLNREMIMQNRFLIVVSFFLSVAVTPCFAEAQNPVAGTPGHRSPKGPEVSILQKSQTPVVVEQKQDYWYEVQNSSGVKGWAFGGYLEMK